MKMQNVYRLEVLDPVDDGEPYDVQRLVTDEDGNERLQNYIIREVMDHHNDVTDEGAEHMIAVAFDGDGSGGGEQSQEANWYLGLVNNSGFSAFADGDTMSSHAGWTEFTGYTEATRPEWEPGSPSSRAITNGSTVDFTCNTTATLQGAFLVAENTKSGTTGKLWATMAFTSPKSVSNGTVLRLTYTIEVAT